MDLTRGCWGQVESNLVHCLTAQQWIHQYSASGIERCRDMVLEQTAGGTITPAPQTKRLTSSARHACPTSSSIAYHHSTTCASDGILVRLWLDLADHRYMTKPANKVSCIPRPTDSNILTLKHSSSGRCSNGSFFSLGDTKWWTKLRR